MKNMEYAGFWVRVGAASIDSILIMLITAPILTMIYGQQYWIKEDLLNLKLTRPAHKTSPVCQIPCVICERPEDHHLAQQTESAAAYLR